LHVDLVIVSAGDVAATASYAENLVRGSAGGGSFGVEEGGALFLGFGLELLFKLRA
jgi:hypothetical protein